MTVTTCSKLARVVCRSWHRPPPPPPRRPSRRQSATVDRFRGADGRKDRQTGGAIALPSFSSSPFISHRGIFVSQYVKEGGGSQGGDEESHLNLTLTAEPRRLCLPVAEGG